MTLPNLGTDLRLAVRSLRRSPAFTCAALLTLALGIGANTATFSLVYGILLEPLPYREGDRLVVLRQSAPAAGREDVPFSIQEVHDYREANRTLQDVVEHHAMTFTLLGRGEPQRVSTGVVSAGFFDALGVEPLHGRTFVDADDDLGAEAVLVLSHGYWQHAFGGDPAIVGQVFEMNNRPHTVVGVLPPIPQYPQEHDVYMPTSACPFRASAEERMASNRGIFRLLTAFGRLERDASLETARADVGRVGAQLAAEHPDTYPPEQGYTSTIEPLRSELIEGSRTSLFVLLGASLAVLLLACANVANLWLARSLRREREHAVRSSLGASRGRLAAQALTESSLLALAGGGLGLAVAYGGLDLLRTFMARFTPRAVEVALDLPVLLFTLGLSLLTGLVFGVLPTLASRSSLASVLRDGTKSTASRGRLRLRSLLVVAQVAAAVMLLAAAGLLLRSLQRLESVDAGFDDSGVLTARLTLNWTRYDTADKAAQFWNQLLAGAASLPGVEEAAIAATRPLSGVAPNLNDLVVEGRPLADGEIAPRVNVRFASEGLFRLLRTPLLAGREFRSSDDGDSDPVAVVSAALVRELFGERDPLGQRVSLDGGTNWVRVIGVVADVRQTAEEEPGPTLYVAVRQGGFAQILFVRTSAPPATLERPVRDLVRSIDPEQPVDLFETLEETRRAATASPRLVARLLGLFALVALLVTVTGIGGLIAFMVSQRTQEIGIRLALGSSRRRVLQAIVGEGLTLATIGVAVGVGAALLFGRALRAMLYETSTHDLVTLVAVAAVVLAGAGVASLLPALRTSRIDPTLALRAD